MWVSFLVLPCLTLSVLSDLLISSVMYVLLSWHVFMYVLLSHVVDLDSIYLFGMTRGLKSEGEKSPSGLSE